MKKLVLSLIVGVSLFGFDIVPYSAYLDYSKSVKDKGYVVGIYSSHFFKTTTPFKLEVDLEHTLISYKDNTPDWKQNDITLIGNFYKGENLAFKGGIHYINVRQDDVKKEDNYIYIIGASYYKGLKYNVGVDVFYGNYEGFHTYQVSPKAGISFGDYYSEIGSFYLESIFNYMYVSNNEALNSNYTNIDIKFQNFKGPWTTTLKASLGKNAYKVANGGFVVYNLSNEYRNSFGVDVSYSFEKVNSIKVGYTRSEFLNNDQKKGYANIYTISYYRAF